MLIIIKVSPLYRFVDVLPLSSIRSDSTQAVGGAMMFGLDRNGHVERTTLNDDMLLYYMHPKRVHVSRDNAC